MRTSIKCAVALAALFIFLGSCSAPRTLIFANREWHMSNHYGQIIDKDTTYRMTFGNVLIPDPLPIVSCADSLAKYPGMDKFLSDILHTAHLDSAEILFYAPHMRTMFVRPQKALASMRPSAITSPMSHELPLTMWINEDDIENWKRDSTQMYTYVYYSKRKRQLLIVDHYDYGDMPMAQIYILQSRNRRTDKMGVRDNLRRVFFKVHDITKPMRYIEFWSNHIEARRARAISNYKIGQQQKRRSNGK